MKYYRFALLAALTAGLGATISAQEAKKEAPKKEAPKVKEVFTEADDPTMPVDFKIQGEYANKEWGIQVIALGKEAFQAVVYKGGLPGAGWDGKNRSLLAGKLDGTKASFKPAEGKRKYLGNSADEFSATDKFPPAGHEAMDGSADGTSFKLQAGDGKALDLPRANRVSPTMGMKAPAGAVVLFDGSSNAAFTRGRIDEKTKFLNTDGNDINTKEKFSNYTCHIEFMLPYRPAARGQGRGNSGFYQVLMYEVQILDSFGLEGKNNECGGVYTKAAPKVNMCLPPLTWQTYDVEFTNAVMEGDKKVKNARLTLKHNGVVVHDNIEIDGKTGGARGDAEGTPGPLQFQGHGNPVQFRNMWIVEKK